MDRNYAAVAADTFSSELGILSSAKPRLIMAPWRTVPPGTNGGVTATGIQAGLLGAALLSFTAMTLMPFCYDNGAWNWREKNNFAFTMTALGTFGSLLDSVLGSLLQASVVDSRTGKVVQGEGGRKVLVTNSMTNRRSAEGDAGSRSVSKGDTTSSRSRQNPSVESDQTVTRQQSRRVEVGSDILSNNGVNFVMALTISVVAMAGASWLWEIPLHTIIG